MLTFGRLTRRWRERRRRRARRRPPARRFAEEYATLPGGDSLREAERVPEERARELAD